MSKLVSRVSLTADDGSADEYLCPGMPDTEEQIADTDGYCDFLEDNPDAESITVDVEHYLYGDGESENADEDDIAEFEKRGEDFLDSDEVDYLDYNRFVIPIGSEGFSMEEMT